MTIYAKNAKKSVDNYNKYQLKINKIINYLILEDVLDYDSSTETFAFSRLYNQSPYLQFDSLFKYKSVDLHVLQSGKTTLKELESSIKQKTEPLTNKIQAIDTKLVGLNAKSPEYAKLQAEIQELEKQVAAENARLDEKAKELAAQYKTEIKQSDAIALIAYIRSLGTKIITNDSNKK